MFSNRSLEKSIEQLGVNLLDSSDVKAIFNSRLLRRNSVSAMCSSFAATSCRTRSLPSRGPRRQRATPRAAALDLGAVAGA